MKDIIKYICFNILKFSRLYGIIYFLLQQLQKYIICVRGSQVTDLENYTLLCCDTVQFVNNLSTFFYMLFVVCPSTLKQGDGVNYRISC
jgi:hypothetical protein